MLPIRPPGVTWVPKCGGCDKEMLTASGRLPSGKPIPEGWVVYACATNGCYPGAIAMGPKPGWVPTPSAVKVA